MKPWKIISIVLSMLITIGIYFLYKVDFSLFQTDINFTSSSNKIEVELVPEVNQFNLVAVGDVLIHSPVYNAAYLGNNTYDFNYMFNDVREIISTADLAFYNQESIIGGRELGISSYPRFNSPYEIGDAAINAGFDLVSLANNHTLDKGEQGIINSLNYWSKKDAITAGSYLSFDDRNNIAISEINGVSYAFLSYTTLTNGLTYPTGKDYLVNVYSESKVKEDIESIRDKVDLVFVSMHWGTEYTLNQISSQETIAEYLSSLDVDVIIGHHPHVVEPIEYIDDTLVIYSLGNFLSNQYVSSLDRAVGAIANINFEKVEDGDTSFVNITSVEVVLTYCYKDSTGKFRIYPFDKITNSILNNYENSYNKYKNVIIKLDSSIKVKPLE